MRPSRQDDFDSWFALYEEVAAEGLWIGAEIPVDRMSRRASFERYIEEGHAAMFLAELDGELVGDISARLEGGVADLGMMVRDGHRGAGIGSTLMDTCIEWCRAHGAHKVALSVWPHNARARALYRKYGFVDEGRLLRHHRRRTGELWDAVVMGLVLDTESPGSPHRDDGLVS